MQSYKILLMIMPFSFVTKPKNVKLLITFELLGETNNRFRKYCLSEITWNFE